MQPQAWSVGDASTAPACKGSRQASRSDTLAASQAFERMHILCLTCFCSHLCLCLLGRHRELMDSLQAFVSASHMPHELRVFLHKFFERSRYVLVQFRVPKLFGFACFDNSMREIDWCCRKRGTQARARRLRQRQSVLRMRIPVGGLAPLMYHGVPKFWTHLKNIM